METILQEKKCRFSSHGFEAENTQGIIPYDRILSVKRDVSSGTYKFTYYNEKGKKRESEIEISNSNSENLDSILREKISGSDVIIRNRTIIEAASSWLHLFVVVALISLATIYLACSGESLRVPVILIPIIELGFKLGLDNIILINIGTAIVCTAGIIFSYTRKKQIYIFNNKNNI